MEPTTALAIQDLVSCCVGSKRSLGNPVHKVRKSYRTIVSVIWLYEKKAFMNSVIADDSTGIAQPFNVRAQIERQDLIPQVSPCAAEMNDKTLERKPQHRASALRRPAGCRRSARRASASLPYRRRRGAQPGTHLQAEARRVADIALAIAGRDPAATPEEQRDAAISALCRAVDDLQNAALEAEEARDA